MNVDDNSVDGKFNIFLENISFRVFNSSIDVILTINVKDSWDDKGVSLLLPASR